MKVNLSFKKLTTFTLDMLECDPEEVTHLDLSHNNIYDLPNDIGKMRNLQFLLANNNYLVKISEDIVNLKKLIWLDLSYNGFTKFPDELGQIDKLSTLDFSYNHLTQIPHSITNLINLEWLDLSHNAFCGEFPEVIWELKNLETFDISYNFLKILSYKDLRKLTKLKRFLIQKNPICNSKLDIDFIEANLPKDCVIN